MTGDNLKVSVDQNTSQIDVKRNGESPTKKGFHHCGGFMDNSVHKKKLPNMHAPMKNTEGFRVSTP